ncbi:MAG TPA: HEAT repeat domain-containing protein [Abditibacteriaceae bacterium]|jgi:hypothetical protein
MTKLFALVFFGLLSLRALPAHAYAVGRAPSLRSLTQSADFVVKATALRSQPVVDASFYSGQGFKPYKTHFKIVSSIKGEAAGEIEFHHMGFDQSYGSVISYIPNALHFEAGRTYLLWAKKTPQGNWRQIDEQPLLRSSGALQTLDDTPIPDTKADINDIAWNELMTLLQSDNSLLARAAMRKLDSLSNWDLGVVVFDRPRVLKTLAPFFTSPEEAIAHVAIDATRSQKAPTIQAELIEATKTGFPSVRAAALLALMDLKTAEVRVAALANARDNSPVVRAAALLLLADFRGPEARAEWRNAATSRDEKVRTAVADAVGKAHDGAMPDVLDTLLDDTAPTVREAAARALLVLPAASAHGVWKKRRAHRDYWMVFVNALAAKDAAPYRADLARAVLTKTRPPGNVTPNGQDAAYTSWHLLFEDLRGQPRAFQLAAQTVPLWDALENGGDWGSDAPEQLYEWLRRIGLETRAQSFRRRVEAKKTYMTFHFNRADEEIKSGRAWHH